MSTEAFADTPPDGGGGGDPQEPGGLAELRGAGVALAKSAALSSASVQPLAARASAVVFESPAAAAEPS
jgi:hypothetical protein